MPIKPPEHNHQLYRFTLSLLISIAILNFLTFATETPYTQATPFIIYAVALLHAIASHVIYNSR